MEAERKIGKMILQTQYQNYYNQNKKSLFWIREVELENKQNQKHLEFQFDVDSIRERDLSDFFKFLYQGFIEVEIYDY